MNNDAQVHPVDGGVAIGNVNFALEIFRRYREMGLLDGLQGTLEPVDDFVQKPRGSAESARRYTGLPGAKDPEDAAKYDAYEWRLRESNRLCEFERVYSVSLW